jgi:hypothetical protein
VYTDDRLANPAYGLLLVTGLLMIWRGQPIQQFWIVLALAIVFCMVVKPTI